MNEPQGWSELDALPRHRVSSLAGAGVPVQPGVYAWYRDGAPVYVDAARSLAKRLLEIDTQPSRWRTSSFRPRVRALLDAQDPGHVPVEDVDAWIAGCEVAWYQVGTFQQAEAEAARLAQSRVLLLHQWRPRPGEDVWLSAYLRDLGDAAGRCYVEVPIRGARPGPGVKVRYLDGVRVVGARGGDIRYYDDESFRADIRGRTVEIIEVKRSLNRAVIGQLIVARDLASLEWEGQGPVRLVAVCVEPDAVLEGVCQRNGIDVRYIPGGHQTEDEAAEPAPEDLD